jgi:hypothetical protein
MSLRHYSPIQGALQHMFSEGRHCHGHCRSAHAPPHNCASTGSCYERVCVDASDLSRLAAALPALNGTWLNAPGLHTSLTDRLARPWPWARLGLA